MNKSIQLALSFLLLALSATAQDSEIDNCIPGDNVLRFYRLAIPVANSALIEDFDGQYSNVLDFWRQCEDFVNRVFIPAGFCFDVVEDERLVMQERNLIDESIYNATSFGTELVDGAIGSSAYDMAMWVAYRPDNSENTGLSVQYGAYSHSTKGSGYAKPDCWVVAHEIGHLLGADHTPPGEGSLMDNAGEFLSLPSIMEIRQACMQRNAAYYADEQRTRLVGDDAGGNYVYGVKVENEAPQFVAEEMNLRYTIPRGACLAVELHAVDSDDDVLSYMSTGNDTEFFAALPPQTDNVVDYRPRYSADIFYPEYFYSVAGTDIPSLDAGSYGVKFLVHDRPVEYSLEAMRELPFYCCYAVWEATVEVVDGEAFCVGMSPVKDEYRAGERVTVRWGVNEECFYADADADASVRVLLSDNYGKSFDYLLAGSVPMSAGECAVTLPDINIGCVDVDFITAVRSMPGGVVRVEVAGGVAYSLSALSPEAGGSFTISGGADTAVGSVDAADCAECVVYDITGRRVKKVSAPGVYFVNGKKVLVR